MSVGAESILIQRFPAILHCQSIGEFFAIDFWKSILVYGILRCADSPLDLAWYAILRISIHHFVITAGHMDIFRRVKSCADFIRQRTVSRNLRLQILVNGLNGIVKIVNRRSTEITWRGHSIKICVKLIGRSQTNNVKTVEVTGLLHFICFNDGILTNIPVIIMTVPVNAFDRVGQINTPADAVDDIAVAGIGIIECSSRNITIRYKSVKRCVRSRSRTLHRACSRADQIVTPPHIFWVGSICGTCYAVGCILYPVSCRCIPCAADVGLPRPHIGPGIV